MNKIIIKIIRLVVLFGVVIGILIGFAYWGIKPGPIDISKKEVKKEIEEWVGFEVPDEFEIVKAWDYGYAPGDYYYSYEIQFTQNGFEQFIENWNKNNKELSWRGGDPNQALNIDIEINPEERKVLYMYAND